MALTQKRMVGPTQLNTTTSTVLYTTPISTTAIAKQIILCNITGSAVTVTLVLKPLGVAQASSQNFLNVLSLAANETVTISTSLVLKNNGSTANATNSDQIIGSASSNSAVNIIVTGIEES
jgi:hypothetical protein